MADVNVFKSKKLKLDWDELLPTNSDDRPPDLVITSSEKSYDGGDGRMENVECDVRWKTDDQLNDLIRRTKSNISKLGPKLPDNGDKFKATIRKCEAEIERRKRIKADESGGGGNRCEETIQLSDQSDDGGGESWLKERSSKNALASSKFTQIFSKTLNQNDDKFVKCPLRTVNAFQKELSVVKPCKEKKVKQNGQIASKKQSKPRFSFKKQQFRCPTTVNSNGDKKVNNRSVISSCLFVRVIVDSFPKKSSPQDQPSIKSSPKVPSSPYHLVDEDIDDIEEPEFFNTPYAEKLSDCMKDVTVYYPSRDDRDPVEVVYTDMKCLEPEACLSSSIMNFYIRYLQEVTSSSENEICNYHFFNTYFYNKLQKLSYCEDSFLKIRKWWKYVNIFEKAYILLPVHEKAHWSLAIICIPTKKDELGPIVLHLDSLGLHDSTSICDNIRSFVKEEWSYLRNSEKSLDLPITDEIWENLDRGILNKIVAVPQQRNTYDCGLFVLFYMERFIKEAPKRLTEKDLSMFSKQWFRPEEASSLRIRINNLLVEEFKIAKNKETISSRKC